MTSSKHDAKLLYLVKKIIRKQRSPTGCTFSKICYLVGKAEVNIPPCEIKYAVRNALEAGVKNRDILKVADDVFAVANLDNKCEYAEFDKKHSKVERSKENTSSTTTIYTDQNQQSRELRDRIKHLRKEYKCRKERQNSSCHVQNGGCEKSSPKENEKSSKLETVKCCVRRAYNRMGTACHKVGPSTSEEIEVDETGIDIAKSVYKSSHSRRDSEEEKEEKTYDSSGKQKRKKLRKRRPKRNKQKPSSVVSSTSSELDDRPRNRRESKKRRKHDSTTRFGKYKRNSRQVAKTIKRNNTKIFCLW